LLPPQRGYENDRKDAFLETFIDWIAFLNSDFLKRKHIRFEAQNPSQCLWNENLNFRENAFENMSFPKPKHIKLQKFSLGKIQKGTIQIGLTWRQLCKLNLDVQNITQIFCSRNRVKKNVEKKLREGEFLQRLFEIFGEGFKGEIYLLKVLLRGKLFIFKIFDEGWKKTRYFLVTILGGYGQEKNIWSLSKSCFLKMEVILGDQPPEF